MGKEFARILLPAALASVPFGFLSVRVRVRVYNSTNRLCTKQRRKEPTCQSALWFNLSTSPQCGLSWRKYIAATRPQNFFLKLVPCKTMFLSSWTYPTRCVRTCFYVCACVGRSLVTVHPGIIKSCTSLYQNLLVLLVNDSEYSQSAGAKTILSPRSMQLVMI
jgi:hypothetical protein